MLMQTPAAAGSADDRDTIEADLCILGAGPGGLALAIAAADHGCSVVLVEKHTMGGNSLNYGSLSAAALAGSADRAQAFRTAGPFGIAPTEPVIDRSAVADHIAAVIASNEPNASAERLTGLGVRIIMAAGRFVDPGTVTAGQYRIVARRFVIATGTAPVIPDISGLARLPYLTTDTVFSDREPFDHMIIVGGGAAGVELAQSHRRLGARVTLIDRGAILKRIDAELASVVCHRLAAEGVVLMPGATISALSATAGRIEVDVSVAGVSSRLDGSHLLIACGRRPALAELGLSDANVAHSPDGIKTDARLRTSNSRVYAIGDVVGLPYSTHRAHQHARLLVQSLLFGTSARQSSNVIPLSIHTDPEFASVGLSEAEARIRNGAVQVLRWPVLENARALALGATSGHIKVIASRSGVILGAAIVSRSASELIHSFTLAVSRKMTLDEFEGVSPAYPALGEIGQSAAANRSRASAGRGFGSRVMRFLAKPG